MDQRVNALWDELCSTLRSYQAVAVAFSGGADSTLLLAAARDLLGADHVLALTAVTPYMVRQEIGEAVAMAAELGVRHELVEMGLPEGMDHNPSDRCYRCKHRMYTLLRDRAEALGFDVLLDASNVDDAEDFRPGLRAARELGVLAPFSACHIGKSSVRAVSKELGLPTWRKPTNACLLTRLRFDRHVSMQRLQQIEEGERLLSERGYNCVRVRCHDDLARIEVAPEQRERLLREADAVVAGLRALGFRYVSLDLIGYQMGSMNDGQS
ncbi:MAG: ATP-dependent sacrificial sulfur transferase LarE [Chromatiales bacterium]|jgi:uncharacterized protein